MDFYTDHGALFVRLFNSRDLPEFVKTAEYDSEWSVCHLPASSFASPADRRFPIHTPADTYVSAAYAYAKLASVPDDVAQAFKSAATIFGIESELGVLIDTVAGAGIPRPQVKTATVEDRRWRIEIGAFSAHGTGGKSLDSKSQEWTKVAHKHDYHERTEIADAFLKVAATLGAEVVPAVKSLACQGECDPEYLKVAIYQRAQNYPSQRERDDLLRIANSLSADTTGAPEDLHKVAAMLDTFDRHFGICRQYGRGVIEPHLAVWNLPEGRAAHAPAIKIGALEWNRDQVEARIDGAWMYVRGEHMPKTAGGETDWQALAGLDEREQDLVNQALV